MPLRETENNAYAKFWGDKQRALWYVMVFSGVVNCNKYYCRGNVAGILGILLMNSETVDICRGDSYL